MADLKKYNYWGNENAPPENLKTKKQLSELGLSPKEPVAFIHMKSRHYDLFLYDINNPESVKPKRLLTPKQKEGLEKARLMKEYKKAKTDFLEARSHSSDKLEMIYWSQSILQRKSEYVILDTETTGLYEAQIVQIAIINLDGEPVLNSLCKPNITIPDEVIRIHGITNEMVKDAPSFLELYEQIKKAVEGKIVIIYNANFDERIIDFCCLIHQLPSIEMRSYCLMHKYAKYYGERHRGYSDYKWQKLPGAKHTARQDCLASLKLLEMMANTPTPSREEIEKEFEQYWKEKLEQKALYPDDDIPF